MIINVIADPRHKIPIKRLKKALIAQLDQRSLEENNVLNIAFIGSRKMKSIVSTYKRENRALPVLSFSYKDDKNVEENLIGEVIVCYPQAVMLSAERNKTVFDTLMSLIIHGIDNIVT